MCEQHRSVKPSCLQGLSPHGTSLWWKLKSSWKRDLKWPPSFRHTPTPLVSRVVPHPRRGHLVPSSGVKTYNFYILSKNSPMQKPDVVTSPPWFEGRWGVCPSLTRFPRPTSKGSKHHVRSVRLWLVSDHRRVQTASDRMIIDRLTDSATKPKSAAMCPSCVLDGEAECPPAVDRPDRWVNCSGVCWCHEVKQSCAGVKCLSGPWGGDSSDPWRRPVLILPWSSFRCLFVSLDRRHFVHIHSTKSANWWEEVKATSGTQNLS